MALIMDNTDEGILDQVYKRLDMMDKAVNQADVIGKWRNCGGITYHLILIEGSKIHSIQLNANTWAFSNIRV